MKSLISHAQGLRARFNLSMGSKLVIGSLLFLLIALITNPQRIDINSQLVVEQKGMLANPAAVYCKEMGFNYQTVDRINGQKGVCHFTDEKSCNAWNFLKGTCGQEYTYCSQQGYQIKTKQDGQNVFTPEYAVCVSEDGKELGSVTDLFRLKEKSTGCQGKVGDEAREEVKLDGTYNAEGDAAPPTSFDWRNTGPYGDKNWLTPIRDQGICGSCWAFSAVGVAEAAFNIEADNPALDKDLSEQYLVSDCDYSSGDCCGGWKDSALSYIRDYGLPDEGCMAYEDGDPITGCSCSYDSGSGYYTCDANCEYSDWRCSDTTCSDRCGDWDSRLEHVTDVFSVSSDLTSLKQALVDHGPLAVSLDMGGSFDGDIFRCSVEDGYTNHAVSIVGYDDPGGYWIVRNSWGTGYQDSGYFKVGFGECSIESYAYYADFDAGVSGPVNDDIVDAVEISSGSLPYTNSQDTAGATLEEGEPSSWCAPGAASVWYTFTPASTGLYEVDTIGSAYDTVLDVYEDLGGGNYQPISCNDDEGENWTLQSRTVFNGDAGTNYLIGIKEFEGG